MEFLAQSSISASIYMRIGHGNDGMKDVTGKTVTLFSLITSRLASSSVCSLGLASVALKGEMQ